jgi:hypothetical protein
MTLLFLLDIDFGLDLIAGLLPTDKDFGRLNGLLWIPLGKVLFTFFGKQFQFFFSIILFGIT